MRTLLIIGLLILVFSHNAFASEQGFVNGAGTLKGGTWAVSLDLGGAYPEPLLWGARIDRGFGNRVQLGIAGSSLILLNTFAINGLFNILKTKEDSDFLSVYLTPSFLHLPAFGFEEEEKVNKIFVFLIQPGLAYEHRFGEKRNTGFFAKAGTFHVIGATADGGFWLAPMTTETTVITFGGGLQHNFGGSLSATAEAGGGVLLGNVHRSVNLMMLKFGLTWAF